MQKHTALQSVHLGLFLLQLFEKYLCGILCCYLKSIVDRWQEMKGESEMGNDMQQRSPAECKPSTLVGALTAQSALLLKLYLVWFDQ